MVPIGRDASGLVGIRRDASQKRICHQTPNVTVRCLPARRRMTGPSPSVVEMNGGESGGIYASSSLGNSRSERFALRLTVGHKSEMLRQKNSKGHTHRWTVFVEGPAGTELDQGIVQKIVFQLHDTFENPTRVCKSPPYKVTETGYAGFSIPIFISFVGCKQHFPLEYCMDLSMTPTSTNKEIKQVEIKDPKPGLRAKLIEIGAEIMPQNKFKATSPSSSKKKKAPVSKFEDLFGPTIPLQPKIQPKDKIASKTKTMTERHKSAKNTSVTTNGAMTSKESPKSSEETAGMELRLSLSPMCSSPSLSPKLHPVIKAEVPIAASSNKKTDTKIDDEESIKKKRLKAELKHEKARKVSPKNKETSETSESGTRPVADSGVTNRGLNQVLLNQLIAAVGGDQSDVESIYSSKPSLPRSESPIFQTGDSPEPEARRDREIDEVINSPELVPKREPIKTEDSDETTDSKNDGGKKKKKKLKRERTGVERVDSSSAKKPKKNSPKIKSKLPLNNEEEKPVKVKSEPQDEDGVSAKWTLPSDNKQKQTEDFSRLRALQERIMSVREPKIAQQLANIVFDSASFDITSGKFLEFDLCSLNVSVVDALFQCLESAK